MGLFYSLGKAAGPKIRKGKWIWQSLTGSQAEAIAAEYDVGRDLAAEVERQIHPDNDAETVRIIREIGSRLRERLREKRRKFTFAVIGGGEPNAFALPGGFIYITRSLLELCEYDSDEIAFVLGHEMGHVIRGHAMERIVSDSAVKTISRAAPVRGAVGGWIKRVGIQFLESAYSQDRELDADRLGARLSIAAGFSAKGPERLLERLAKLEQTGRLSELSSYLSSHPPLSDRIRAIRSQQTQ
jgi:predicted Zn-dependent protease